MHLLHLGADQGLIEKIGPPYEGGDCWRAKRRVDLFLQRDNLDTIGVGMSSGHRRYR